MDATSLDDYPRASPREDHQPEHEAARHNESSATAALPPTDGGTAAWLFLFGSFMIETLIWGFPFSFGVLQDYYSTHLPISRNPSGISAVGTTCSGILYLASPVFYAILQRWPRSGRPGLYIGLAIMVVALVLSSYATQVWHLVLTQGVLLAIGGSCLYYPTLIYVDQWFIRRKGLAFGVIWAGSGCGGLSGPNVLQWGLTKYGAQTFLKGWAIALTILVGPLLHFVRPRVPASQTHRTPVRMMVASFGFVKTPTFVLFQISNVVQGLGYFIPALWLPTYARFYGSPSGSLLVSLLNVSSVPGVVIMSYLSDYFSVFTLVMVSSVGSAVAVFLLWGLSAFSLPLLIVFSILYGFFAGGFTATYAGVAMELRRVTPGGEQGRAEIGSIFGLVSAGRGIGNVICGPVSELLLKHGSLSQGAKGAYGGAFGSMIIFTGTTAAVTMSSWAIKKLKVV